jgi:hypothetical protein
MSLVSALSDTSCETRGVERSSWRDSTISALEKAVRYSGSDDGVHVRLGNRDELRISAPIQGTFEHVDGAFVFGGRCEEDVGMAV